MYDPMCGDGDAKGFAARGGGIPFVPKVHAFPTGRPRVRTSAAHKTKKGDDGRLLWWKRARSGSNGLVAC